MGLVLEVYGLAFAGDGVPFLDVAEALDILLCHVVDFLEVETDECGFGVIVDEAEFLAIWLYFQV